MSAIFPLRFETEAIAMEPVVTVGLDGSPESLDAARWAAEDASRRRYALRLMHAWVMLAEDENHAPSENEQNYWAERIVHDAHAEVRKDHPDLPVIEELVAGQPLASLMRALSESEMLVLGSRGMGTVEAFLLGDVSLGVVARAERPVVLVRRGLHMAERSGSGRGRVVLGLDPQDSTDALLEFAFSDAAARGVPLEVVNAYHGHGIHRHRNGRNGRHKRNGNGEAAQQLAKEMQRRLDETVEPWREKFPGVEMIDTVRQESPTKAMVHAAEGAELLIVGRRLHRAHRAARIGNVAHAALHHAPCPVAVIPYD
ncbi:universal stress protein [Streptomyces sp. NPDC047108]|uniref:universal stress protein n=1 Tax=Streptomyces sp. NPDC047108 TaxID=3155025 RepID=UPI0033EE4AFE